MSKEREKSPCSAHHRVSRVCTRLHVKEFIYSKDRLELNATHFNIPGKINATDKYVSFNRIHLTFRFLKGFDTGIQVWTQNKSSPT